jgi:hypothetical protein
MKPRSVRTLSRSQQSLYQRHANDLSRIGIPVGSDGDFTETTPKVHLEQLDPGLAAFFDLPGSGFIFVSTIRQIVFKSSMIVDFEMAVEWDELPLEIEEPEAFTFYKDCATRQYSLVKELIYPWLTGRHQLRQGQIHEGYLFARGQRAIPAKYPDNSRLQVSLSLWDENKNESRYVFGGHVDRSIKHKYERKLQEVRRLSPAREPLFGRELEEPTEARSSPARSPLASRGSGTVLAGAPSLEASQPRPNMPGDTNLEPVRDVPQCET